MKKSFLFWIYFVVAVILATYFATRIIMTVMGHGVTAQIKSISISSNAGKDNLQPIAVAVGILPGTRSFSVDLDTINARIANTPGVKISAVRRMPNGNMAIRVRMHHAVALWTNGDAFYPLSGDGTIINTPTDFRPDKSIVFRGVLPSDDITEIAKAAHNIPSVIEYIEWIDGRRWNIHTYNNITVLLPEDDPITAINTLMTLDKNHNIFSKKIQLLDMRDRARILIK